MHTKEYFSSSTELSGAAFALTSLPATLPSNAVDGLAATAWKAPTYHTWWLYDLKTPCFLEKVHVDTGADEPSCYYLETSVDHLNWRTIGETNPLGEVFSSWDVSTEARYVRITFTYSKLGSPVQLSDVRILGWPLEHAALEDRAPGDAFYAYEHTVASGFENVDGVCLEPGWNCTVMQTGSSSAFLGFEAIDFGEESNQLRGYFGLLNSNRALLVDIEIRLDSREGSCIGTMQAFRQWKCWNEFACDIVPTSGKHSVFILIKHIDAEQTLQICHLRFVRNIPFVHTSTVLEQIEESDHFQVYTGLLHSHTCFSDGANVPEYAYAYARDVGRLDFLAITEHSNLFDEAFDCNKSRKLRDLRAAAERATENGRFVGLVGSETTWYNQFGHMNIYADDFYINAYEVKYNTIANYYDVISRYPDVVNQWNHPWSCGIRHLDSFSPYDPKLDDVMCLLEVNPYEDPAEGGLGYYLKALNMGYHVAPCGSQDNHKEDWGTQNNLRTAILCSDLTKAHLFDAIKHRRVYFTCCPSLKIEYRVNNQIMGSRINRCEQYEVMLKAEVTDGSTALHSLQILGMDGRIVAEQALRGYCAETGFSVANISDAYLFARVYAENGEFAVTSPVWFA